jgi:hypothetical protein
MPLVCEISLEDHCRPNDVIRPSPIHASNRISPSLTFVGQLRPVHIAYALR